jgi:DNA repair protein RadA/Sms
VGGLQVEEPAVDMAVALALTSSLRDQSVPADLALVGEVGLSGEVRSVGQLEARLSEAARLGFSKAIVPRRLGRTPLNPPQGLQVIQVRSVREAVDAALKTQ